MKKLSLSVEELAVETFDVGAPRRGQGTVAGQAATNGMPGEPCYPPSEGINIAMCAPTTVGEECVTVDPQCPLGGGVELTSPEAGC